MSEDTMQVQIAGERSAAFAPRYGAVLHAAAVFAFYAVLFSLYFSPILFSDRLLAPGDGEKFYFPAFSMPWTAWSPDLFAGFPVAADPQMQAYYPVRWLFSPFAAWNAYVVCAYVIAACFTYGYVFTLTGSIVAALASGIIYAASGFFIVHLGHTAMIHSAAWIPLIFWAVERMRVRRGGGWMVVASIAVAHCAFAGHPQILVFGMGIAVLYVVVLGWTAPAGRWWYYRSCVMALLIGCGLAAIQLLPMLELAQLSPRTGLPFELFVQYALSPAESLRLLFPYVFGSIGVAPYRIPYFGSWNMAETTGYVGWLALTAALLAVLQRRHDVVMWFWAAVVVLAFLLALGHYTPLAWVMYHVPLYSRFRCPGRHLMEFSLGVATLAGLGIAALQQSQRARWMARRATGITLVVAGSSVLSVALLADQMRAMAAQHAIMSVPLSPWENPAIGVPLMLAAISATTIVWYSRGARSRMRSAVLLLVLVVDLGSTGWFCEWRFFAPHAAALQLPMGLRPYKEQVVAGHVRVATYASAAAPRSASAPNLSRVWGVPNAAGYSPLALLRHESVLPWRSRPTLQSENRVLDILAARFLLKHRGDDTMTAEDPPDAILGVQHAALGPLKISDVRTSRVVLLAALLNARLLSDGVPVARLKLTTTEGQVITLPIRAGDDVSEWAYDRAAARRPIRHRRARIFDRLSLRGRHGRLVDGNCYVAALDLNGAHQLRGLDLEWTGPPGAQMMIWRISLNDEHGDLSLLEGVGLQDRERWRHIEDIEDVAIYENLRVMPRAWLVPSVMTVQPHEAFEAIRHSRLPDGTDFDPWHIALVEEPVDLASPDGGGRGEATVVALTDTSVVVKTRSAADAFLVLSDVYYPGWRAAVDGRSVQLYQTDYLLRGLVVPAGEHVVTFSFRSSVLYVGLGVSALSACLLVALPLLLRRSIV